MGWDTTIAPVRSLPLQHRPAPQSPWSKGKKTITPQPYLTLGSGQNPRPRLGVLRMCSGKLMYLLEIPPQASHIVWCRWLHPPLLLIICTAERWSLHVHFSFSPLSIPGQWSFPIHLEDPKPIQQLGLIVLPRFLQKRDGCFFSVLKHAFHCQGAQPRVSLSGESPGLTSFEERCLLITQLVLAALLSWLSWQAICHSVISPTLFDADGTLSKESTFSLFFLRKRWGSHQNKHLAAYFLGC